MPFSISVITKTPKHLFFRLSLKLCNPIFFNLTIKVLAPYQKGRCLRAFQSPAVRELVKLSQDCCCWDNFTADWCEPCMASWSHWASKSSLHPSGKPDSSKCWDSCKISEVVRLEAFIFCSSYFIKEVAMLLQCSPLLPRSCTIEVTSDFKSSSCHWPGIADRSETQVGGHRSW